MTATSQTAGEQKGTRMLQNPRFLITLASGSLTVMTGAALAPILPVMITDLQLNEAWAGSLVSAHYLMLALFSPLLGMVADRVGHVRLLTTSLVIYALLGMAGALLPTFWLLLLDRSLLGIATSGIAAGSIGLVIKMYQGDERTQAIAYISVALTLANIIYPPLASGIGSIQWRLAFTVYGLGIPLAVITWAIFNLGSKQSASGETPPSSSLTDEAANLDFTAVFKQPAISKLFLSLAMVSSLVLGLVIYLPIYLQIRLNTDVGINGIVLACMAIGSALSAVLALKWLTRRFGVLRVIPLSLGAMALILVLIPNLSQLGWIILTAFLFGLGVGLVTPSIYNGLANLAPDHLQSSALATGIGIGFLGQFISPLIFGQVLAASDISGVFYAAAIIALGTGLLFVLPSRRPST